ncbi:hypothetical protein ACVWYG_003784, partial [Pedobacter sp. UYEF25]
RNYLEFITESLNGTFKPIKDTMEHVLKRPNNCCLKSGVDRPHILLQQGRVSFS